MCDVQADLVARQPLLTVGQALAALQDAGGEALPVILRGALEHDRGKAHFWARRPLHALHALAARVRGEGPLGPLPLATWRETTHLLIDSDRVPYLGAHETQSVSALSQPSPLPYKSDAHLSPCPRPHPTPPVPATAPPAMAPPR